MPACKRGIGPRSEVEADEPLAALQSARPDAWRELEELTASNKWRQNAMDRRRSVLFLVVVLGSTASFLAGHGEIELFQPFNDCSQHSLVVILPPPSQNSCLWGSKVDFYVVCLVSFGRIVFLEVRAFQRYVVCLDWAMVY